MGLTLELPDELASALAGEASRLGLSLPEYAVRLLASAQPAATPIPNGAALVAYWQAEGVAGGRPDITDSQGHARSIREQAERWNRCRP